ncbi:hypothetical protein LINPERHAP2_LOCUS43469 [Linum perenne]
MPPKVLVLVLQLLVLVLTGKIVGALEVNEWECNYYEFPAHHIRRDLVGVILQQLVDSRIPIWHVRAMNTSCPPRRPLLYAYANCTGGPYYGDCQGCLAWAKRTIVRNCPHRLGAKVVRDMCYMRYEEYPF